uniref:hAT-like transposase RNase-H fold domain-containing protein n=1 Tax=Salix viminalis TaxID=40686 RepID=A0A6N2LGZ4_SALVM
MIFLSSFKSYGCCAHIVNLIVSDGLKEINASVVKIPNAIRFIYELFVRLGKSEPRYKIYFLDVDLKRNKKTQGHLVWRIGKMIELWSSS